MKTDKLIHHTLRIVHSFVLVNFVAYSFGRVYNVPVIMIQVLMFLLLNVITR